MNKQTRKTCLSCENSKAYNCFQRHSQQHNTCNDCANKKQEKSLDIFNQAFQILDKVNYL